MIVLLPAHLGGEAQARCVGSQPGTVLGTSGPSPLRGLLAWSSVLVEILAPSIRVTAFVGPQHVSRLQIQTNRPRVLSLRKVVLPDAPTPAAGALS